MKRNWIYLLCMGIALWSSACTSQQKKQKQKIADLSWEEISQQAKGQEVNLMMWTGDPFINDYMQNYVKPALKNQYGITLNISSGQGSAIVKNLMTELEADKKEGELDMMWINGETFYQLRQIDALYGPFLQQLPNSQYLDLDNRFINTDFQQPIEGYECPWGNVQMCLIYNSEKVTNPPRTMAQLADFVKENPGKFTIPNDFTGMTLLKAFLIDLAGGPQALAGPFDQEKYEKYSSELWQYLNRIKPYFWKEGKTFPDAVAPMHQLFAAGELYITMSNNDAEVDNKIAQGLFNDKARAYVLDSGTIQNSHYMGISKLSPHKAADLVVCNFLISPEAQLRKYNPEVWGDGTVLDLNKLPAQWLQRFSSLPQRKYAPKRSEINQRALQELAPEYMIHLYQDFRKNVIEK